MGFGFARFGFARGWPRGAYNTNTSHALVAGAKSKAGAAASNKAPGPRLDAFFVMRKLESIRQRVEAAKAAEFAAAAATRAAQRALFQEEVDSGLKRRKVEPDQEDQNWRDWAHSDEV